jgi:hypothetical protein
VRELIGPGITAFFWLVLAAGSVADRIEGTLAWIILIGTAILTTIGVLVIVRKVLTFLGKANAGLDHMMSLPEFRNEVIHRLQRLERHAGIVEARNAAFDDRDL